MELEANVDLLGVLWVVVLVYGKNDGARVVVKDNANGVCTVVEVDFN